METKQQQEMFFLRSTDRFSKMGYVFIPQTEEVDQILVGKFDGTSGNLTWEAMTRNEARCKYRSLRNSKYETPESDEVLIFLFNSTSSVFGCGFGRLDSVNAWRERLIRNFAPQGYGTRASVKPLEHGMASFSFTRYKSCD